MFSFHFLLLAAIGLLLCRPFGVAFTAGTLAFAALEPTFGAHAPVVMTDLPLALTLTAGRLVRRPAGARLVVALGGGDRARHGFGARGQTFGPARAGGHRAFRGRRRVGSASRGEIGRVDWRLACGAGRPGGGGPVLAVGVLWGALLLPFPCRAGRQRSASTAPCAEKIADLQIPRWRGLVGFADGARLLPRSLFVGPRRHGARRGRRARAEFPLPLGPSSSKATTPWYTWPSYMAAKVPLPLLALALLGADRRLWRERPARAARAGLWAIGVMAGGAPPGAVVFAGQLRRGAPRLAAGDGAGPPGRRRRRLRAGASARRPGPPRSWGCSRRAAATTAQENRLWEYYNEAAGGTAGAWKYFRNEGNDLGQRAPRADPLQPRGDGAHRRKGLFGLLVRRRGGAGPRDEFRAPGQRHRGRQRAPASTRAFSSTTWTRGCPGRISTGIPPRSSQGLEPVARFGAAEVWHGRQVSPRSRAYSLRGKLLEYIYRHQGNDWELVARAPRGGAGGQRLRFFGGDRAGQRLPAAGPAARRRSQPTASPFPRKVATCSTRSPAHGLEGRVAALERGEPLGSLAPLRNPWME